MSVSVKNRITYLIIAILTVVIIGFTWCIFNSNYLVNNSALFQSAGVLMAVLFGFVGMIFAFYQMYSLERQIKISKASSDALIRQLEAAASLALSNRVDEINRMRFEFPDYCEQSNEEYDSNGNSGRHVLLCNMRLSVLEQVFIHNNRRLIDGDTCKGWYEYMLYALDSKFARGHWEAHKKYYNKEFADFVDLSMAKPRPLDAVDV